MNYISSIHRAVCAYKYVLSLFFFLRLSNEHLAAVIETIFSILELPPFCLVQVEGTHLDRVSVKVRNKWIICFTINITM